MVAEETGLNGLSAEHVIVREQYERRTPFFHNIDVADVSGGQRNTSVWSSGRSSLPDSKVHRLRDAVVYDTGAVVTVEGRVVPETLLRNVVPGGSREPHKRIEGTLALLRKPGDMNFGHWLVELLPRIRDFRQAAPEAHLRFGVPTHPISMLDLRLDTLALYGVGREDVVWLSNDAVVVDDLMFMTSNSIHSHTHDAAGVRDLVSRARAAAGALSGERRLYVRRPDHLKRRLLNEDEIASRLTDEGFEIVHPEQMAFREQVRTFAEARYIVGVSGAALTNLIWARRPVDVLSLAPNAPGEFFFWDLANITGARFSTVFGRACDAPPTVHSNFTLEVSWLDRWLSLTR